MGGETGRTAGARKPSRSDEVPELAQQLEITEKTKAYFESLAPKRPAKPHRSEPADDTFPATDHRHPAFTAPPELAVFDSLQSQSHIIASTEEGGDLHQEFVETEYYQRLNSIDRVHHTTGCGFIRVNNLQEGSDGPARNHLPSIDGGPMVTTSGRRSNPATNDWRPSIDEVVFVSNKPARSENCV